MGRPLYGQVVVGPPGSGKTTYCNGMQQYLRLLGRNAWVVNLDPANERLSHQQQQQQQQQRQEADGASEQNKFKKSNNNDDRILPYETIFDVCQEVINLTSVMKETGLGPNGGLVYCMEYLESHVNEVVTLLRNRLESGPTTNNHEKKKTHGSSSVSTDTDENYYYLLFDLPGQVELYTHSTCVQNVLHKLQRILDLRLAAVQLVDAHYCTDASKFLSATLLGTTTLLRLELPTVSVLSKIDLLMVSSSSSPAAAAAVDDGDDEERQVEEHDEEVSSSLLDFQLDYYTDCHELDRLVPFVDPSAKPEAMAASANYNDEDELALVDDVDYQLIRQKRQQQQLSSSSNRFQAKYTKLYQALAEVVEDFGLLQFVTLDISNAASVGRVLAKVDKCNGYVFLQDNTVQSDLFQCAIQQDADYEALAEVKERLQPHQDVTLKKRKQKKKKQST